MPVIGFLLPLLLTIAGGLLGAFLSGGAAGAVWWGVGAGFVLGCIGMAVLLWGWEWITRSGGYDTRE